MLAAHRRLPTALFALMQAASIAAAHPVHTRADSVDGAAMAAVVVEYHRLLAAADSSAYRLLAPAYASIEMNGNSDPRRWLAGALLQSDFVDGWPGGSSAPVKYENRVEVVHVLTRWSRGIVITHEVGSYRDGTWDTHNAWVVMRVGESWRIGASVHGLPDEMRRRLQDPE